MATQKASTSVAVDTSRKEVIKKRSYLSFGVRRLAMTVIDGTQNLILGDSVGTLRSELDSTKIRLEAALAQAEKDRVDIAGLTRKKQEVEADVIWHKDEVRRFAISLHMTERAHIAEVKDLTEALEDSDHRFAEVKIANDTLGEQVHDLQGEAKRFESQRLELLTSERDMYEELCRYSAKAEKAEGEVKGLKGAAERLKEEKNLWRDRFDRMELARQRELRSVKEKDLLIESLRSEVKAKDILVNSLWSEVYEPTETSLTVQRLKKAEIKIEDLSAALQAKERIINNLGGQIDYVENRVYEKDCDLLASEARFRALQHENVDLSDQNTALREEVVRVTQEQQAAMARESEFRGMVARAGVRMYQAAVEISRLQRCQVAFGNELTRLEGVAQAESERVEDALSLARETEVLIEAKDAAISDLNVKLALVTPLPRSQEDSTGSADVGAGAGGAIHSSVKIACECAQLRIKVVDLGAWATELKERNDDLAIKVFEKDCKLMISEAKNEVLRSQNEDLSRQIASEQGAMVELCGEVEDLVECLKSENEQLRSDVTGLRMEKRPRRLSLTG